MVETLVIADYVESDSAEQLAAEALNSLGCKLRIHPQDLVRSDGTVEESGGVLISGIPEEVEMWGDLIRSERVATIRVSEAGFEVDDYIDELGYDLDTRDRVLAHGLTWRARRERAGADLSYWMNVENPRTLEHIASLTGKPVDIEARRQHFAQRKHEELAAAARMEASAQELLGSRKPFTRDSLKSFIKSEARNLFPQLGNG